MRMADDRHWLELRGPDRLRGARPGRRSRVLRDRLGADPLRDDADPPVAYARVRTSTKPVFALLLDQTIVAGCGLIYANEVLFRAGLAPTTPGRAVERASAGTSSGTTCAR